MSSVERVVVVTEWGVYTGLATGDGFEATTLKDVHFLLRPVANGAASVKGQCPRVWLKGPRNILYGVAPKDICEMLQADITFDADEE